MSLSVLRVAAAIWRRAPRETSSPTATRAPVRRRARLAVALFPVAFVLVLLSVWAMAETVTPEITDPDYHVRLQTIRTAVAEHPNQPLGLAFGSSRMVWAFRPEELPEPATGEVLWMNGAHVGAGPTLNRVLLHRLLRDGVRPAVIVLEIMPPFFTKENNRFVSAHFAASDMPLVRGYADKPFGYDYYFLRHRITRATDIARVTDPLAGRAVLLSRGGHPIIEENISAEERKKRTAFAAQMYSEYVHRLTVRPSRRSGVSRYASRSRRSRRSRCVAAFPGRPGVPKLVHARRASPFRRLHHGHHPRVRSASNRRPPLAGGRGLLRLAPRHEARGREIHRPVCPRDTRAARRTVTTRCHFFGARSRM